MLTSTFSIDNFSVLRLLQQ